MRYRRKKGPDLIVLSDLHLGEGMLEDEPRFMPTEDFFHDEQFSHFLVAIRERYKGDTAGVKLVLNGDIFDFLTITTVPTDTEAAAWDFTVKSVERKFGLNPSEKKSIYKLDRIVAGHPVFFKALADFLADGFSMEILRGNHDLELFFEGVKQRLLEHLFALTPELTPARLRKQVRFHEWFYFEPDRVYIEHGNQYDPGNSIRYPLFPIHEEKRKGAGDDEVVLDYPLGSIFVRFFYNRVRTLDPYSPRIVSFDHYLSFIKRYNLFDVWRIYKDHYPHFIAAVSTGVAAGSSGATEGADRRQRAAFDSHAAEDPVPDLYVHLSRLKISPVSASKANVVKEMMTAVVRRMRNFAILAFIAIFAWFGILYLINLVPGLTANSFLMALFAVTTIGAALTVWIHLDRKLRRHEGMIPGGHLVEKAEKISELTGAKLVLMGHTHMVDYRTIRGGEAVYANSGTWTAIDNPWSRFMRDARRLTFLLVEDDKVSLKRWNDDAYRFDPVPLFHLPEEAVMDKLPSEVALDVAVTGRVSLPPQPLYSVDDETVKEMDD